MCIRDSSRPPALSRDWGTLQVVAYLPLLSLLGLWWLVPESPRWLIGMEGGSYIATE